MSKFTRERFMARISDPDECSRFVELLRTAASILDGSTHSRAWGEATIARVSHKSALALREAASELCEHVRVLDGRCRYCETLVPWGEYGMSVIGGSE